MLAQKRIIQRCQPSLFNKETPYFCKYFCPFWHPNLAASLFLASFVPLKLLVILKTTLFSVWTLPIFWMLMLASLVYRQKVCSSINRFCCYSFIYSLNIYVQMLCSTVTIYAARWSQQMSGIPPKLFYRLGRFTVGTIHNRHSFRLEMRPARPAAIKVKTNFIIIIIIIIIINSSSR